LNLSGKKVYNRVMILQFLHTDIFVLVSIFVVMFLYGLYFGKNSLVSLILAYYPAVFLFQTFPFVEKLTVLKGDKLLMLNKVGIFLLFLIPISIIINRYIFAESSLTKTAHSFRIAGLALVSLALVLLFSYTVVDLSIFYNFSSTIDGLFANLTLIWVWNVAPLVLLTFL
jgi:hypothetical protein